MKAPQEHFVWLCVVSLCSTLLLGCEKDKESAKKPDQLPATNAPSTAPNQPSQEQLKQEAKPKLLNLAKAIVADPQNWKSTTAKMADLIEPVNRLGMAEDSAVVQFKQATHKLIEFSARWINNLSTSEIETLTRATGSLEASVTGKASVKAAVVPTVEGEVAATAKASAQSAKNVKMQELQKIVGDKLSFNDATEFSKLFQEALDAYEKLFQKLSPSQQ